MPSEAAQIVARLHAALGGGACADQPLALHEPSFSDEERAAVLDCLNSGWISSAGTYVDIFEKQLADFCNVPHAIACINGTAALHVALAVAGVRPGDEVIVPAISFIATANAVVYNQAIPHFVDICEDDLAIDPVALSKHLETICERRKDGLFNRKTGRRLAAIVPLHCFGYASKIDALVALGDQYDLPVVEDAAESLGSTLHGRALGTFGRASILSFNGNKIITSGGGGAILTADDDVAHQARHLTTTAKVPHKWAYCHDALGYNYRLPSLNAALGVGQLNRIEKFLEDKAQLHEIYRGVFAEFEGISLLEGAPDSRPNHWLNTIVLGEDRSGQRDEIIERAHAAGLMLRPLWDPLPAQPHLQACPAMDWPVARSLAARCLCLPSSHFIAASGKLPGKQAKA